MVEGCAVKNTIIDRVVAMGESPVKIYFSTDECAHKLTKSCTTYEADGVVDSLRFLVHNENFVKPWSSQHILASLLVRAF